MKVEMKQKVLKVSQEGKKEKYFKSWMYYTIFNELRWEGFSQEDAGNIARWSCRADVGDVLEKGDTRFVIEEKDADWFSGKTCWKSTKKVR